MVESLSLAQQPGGQTFSRTQLDTHLCSYLGSSMLDRIELQTMGVNGLLDR